MKKLEKLFLDNGITSFDYDSKWAKLFSDNIEVLEEVFSNLAEAEKNGQIICPTRDKIFSAFKDMDIDKIKVIFVGEDPYPNINHALGKSFLYPQYSYDEKKEEYYFMTEPDSIANMREVFNKDLGLNATQEDFHAFLTNASCNDFLMINTALTIGLTGEEKNAKHLKYWRKFYKMIMEQLSEKKDVLFVLMGDIAIDRTKRLLNDDNMVIKSSHPCSMSWRKDLKNGAKAFYDAGVWKVVEMVMYLNHDENIYDYFDVPFDVVKQGKSKLKLGRYFK